MGRRFTVLMAAALAAIPAVVLVGGAGPAGAVDVGDEAAFRTAWDTATEITLTADITLTCADGGEADRSSNDPVVLDGAGHTIALEPGCIARVLDNNGDGATTLRNVTITGGNTTSDGGGYEHDGTGPLTIENSTFANNKACGDDGGGLEVDEAVPVVIRGSTFVGNRAPFDSAIDMDDGGDLTLVNSTVTGNIANAHSAIAAENGEGVLTLVYSTIVDNIETTDECVNEGVAPDAAQDLGEDEPEEPDGDVGALEAGEPANLLVEDGYTFRSFGTVIAGPIGNATPTPNCEIEPGVIVESAGYNFSDDATCGFTNVATGDRENAGSPGVGALASNGGPTQTMLPNSGSPLLDWIPLGACGGGNDLAGFPVTTDQRGVGRPQGPGCDVGAVEVEFVLSFTG